MSPLSTKQAWFERGLETFRDFLKALEHYGVTVAPDLKLVQENCLFCYYQSAKKRIAFSLPDPDTVKGRLAWHYYRNIVGANDLEEVLTFAQIVLPRFVAHEVAHHLRDRYGTASTNDWIEEHIANTIASAYTQKMFENHRPFLNLYLERAVKKLKGLNDKRSDIRASYQDLSQVLVDQGRILKEDLTEAALFSRQSRMPISDVLIARGFVTRRQWNRLVADQHTLAGYFNTHYMAGLLEYSYFHLSWFLSDLRHPYPLDLGRVLNQYILNRDQDRRRRDESQAVLFQAMRAGNPKQAFAAAGLLIQEMDRSTARYYFNFLESLPITIQPVVFRKWAERQPRKTVVQYSRTVLDAPCISPLTAEAILILHREDRKAARTVIERLIKTPSPQAILQGLNAIRALHLTRYKTIVFKQALSQEPAIRRAAWETIAEFRPPDGKAADLLSQGLSDPDEKIRAGALTLFRAKNPGELKRFLQDSSRKVKTIAARKMGDLRLKPMRLLQDLEFQPRIGHEVLCAGSGNQSFRNPRALRDFWKWGIQQIHRLRAASRNVPQESTYREVVRKVLNDEIVCWRALILRTWTMTEKHDALRKMLPFVDHPNAGLQAYSRKITRKNLPPRFRDLFDDTDSGAALEMTNHTLAELYRFAHPLLRAVLLRVFESTGTGLFEKRSDAAHSPGRTREGDAMKKPSGLTPPDLTAVEKILALKSVHLFREVPVERLYPLADSLVMEEFKPGATIVTQGEFGDSVYLVLSGRVAVEKRHRNGRTSRMAELEAGHAFGEMSILDRETRSATVRAVDQTRCLSLKGDDFRRLVMDDPDLLFEVAVLLSRRLRQIQERSPMPPSKRSARPSDGRDGCCDCRSPGSQV